MNTMENKSIFKTIRDRLNGLAIETTQEVKNLYRDQHISYYGNFQMRDYTPTGVHTGSYGVGKTIAQPEPQQRPKYLVEELGVKYLTNLKYNLGYPLINGNTCSWLEETELGEINDTTFTSVVLEPKRLFTYCEYDRDILVLGDEDLNAAIEQDLKNAVWETVQETMFNGIYPEDDEDITTLEDYEDIINFELAANKKKINNPVYLVSPDAAAKLKGMNTGVFPVVFNGMINGYRMIETPFLSGEKIIFGDFTKLLLGQFGAWDITLNDKTKANKGIIMLIFNTWWDWNIIDPDSFVFGTTETTTTEETTEPTD